MEHVPMEILAQILIKVDAPTIYNLMMASQYFLDILDIDAYWKLRVKKEMPMRPFNHKTYKWLYQCHLARKTFVNNMNQTPWMDVQSEKTYIGDDVEGYIVYKEAHETIMEEIAANLQALQTVEEQDRRFVTSNKTGYYTHEKNGDNFYFFRYAPYDALYVGIMFQNGNIFVDYSPVYMGEIKCEENEIFRSSEGVAVFRSGHTFTKNDWEDETVFIANVNPRLAVPVTTVNVMMVLDQGIDAWIEYCIEKNIDEEWARNFSNTAS